MGGLYTLMGSATGSNEQIGPHPVSAFKARMCMPTCEWVCAAACGQPLLYGLAVIGDAVA